MSLLLTQVFWMATISGGLRLATPLIFAALGETVSQRSGVLNIGLEGYMIVGALAGLYVAAETTTWVGLIAAGFAGALMSTLMVLTSVRWNASQVVMGFGLTIMGIGLTGFIFRETTPSAASARRVSRLAEWDIPGLTDIPFLGQAVFGNNWITWLALALVPVMWWVGQRTIFGLQTRAVGEDPDAAAARGINVIRVRTVAVLASGFFGGLGGGALMLGQVGQFQPAMTANRGFIALVVIIMASWSLWGAAVGAFTFGFFEALGINLRNVVSREIPTEALQAIPFLVALIVLVVSARWARMPRSLGTNFVPER